MTVDEIKIRYPVPDVARQEGIQITRSGFCRCIYHAERTASMKLYEHSWYCFGCGRSGDVVDIIRKLHGLAFQDACVYLTGERAGHKTRRSVVLAKMRQKYAAKKAADRALELKKVNEYISLYRRLKELYEPKDGAITGEYADAVHQYDKYVGMQELLLWEYFDEKRRH